jgi:hypothetical protein
LLLIGCLCFFSFFFALWLGLPLFLTPTFFPYPTFFFFFLNFSSSLSPFTIKAFTKVDSSIDVTQSTKSGQQHAMTSSTHTPPTTTVIKSTPPAITHTSIDLTQQVSSKAIRVERDYSKGDGITKFCTDLPVSLEGKVG